MSTDVSGDRVNVFIQALQGISVNVVITCFVETALWGAFTVLIFASTYSLLRWGSNASHYVMLAVTIIMYMMSTIQWALRIRLIYVELVILLPGFLVPDPRSASFGQQSLTLIVAQTIPLTFNIILSDIIVLWRTCIIWGKNRIVIALSVVLSISITASYVIFNVRESTAQIAGNSTAGSTDVIGPISFSVSLFSNLWSTCMVAFRAWRYAKNIRYDLGRSSRRAASEKIFALLVESGAIYCIIWMLYFITAFGTQILGLFGNYVAIAMSQITGMYPTLIFLLVALEKTRLGESLSLHAETTDITGTIPIVFTPGPTSAFPFFHDDRPMSVAFDNEASIKFERQPPRNFSIQEPLQPEW